MGPSRLFILRPAGTTLLMVALLLTGVLAYQFLPVSTLPEVDYPTIQVSTFYPGASPEVMTTAVTAPLEVQFGEMPGLNQMTSISSAGASVITLQFDLSLSLDVGEQEVQAAINAATSLLPADLPTPPVYAKINPAFVPVVTLAVTSKTLPMTTVQDLTYTRIAQKLSQLPGVGLVGLGGGSGRRSGSRSTLARSPTRASPSTTSARTSPTRTSTSPRAPSTARRDPPPSTRTTRSSTRKATVTW